ncbi:MAG: GIY-YIG nuclease family protein [Candidatus Omnitrophica bacterium]|nr:GIY-YIG nuclease family protein [Candidatus Omnitrophota bacterium]
MYFVYIVQCNNNSLYTGITTDVNRRVSEHNKGKGGNFTSAYRPVNLLYQEQYPDRSQASKREEQIKRWTRKKKLALINGDKEKLKRLSISHD